MPIKNQQELEEAVALVDKHIQEIQDFVGDSRIPAGRIRFPRGYLRTATHFRRNLTFIDDDNLKKNLSYLLILTDVFRWLIHRTDLFGTAKEMVIKNGIVLMGAICESFCKHTTKGIIGRKYSFCDRVTKMAEREMIETDLVDELHWLWEVRSRIHIYELSYSEYGKYSITDYNKAIKTTQKLNDCLVEYFQLES